METDSRYILIAMLEGFVDGLKNGTFKFSDEQGRRLVKAAREILNPNRNVPERICNISMACDYLDISQPTFRKYVREGMITEGMKASGFMELIWGITEIEAFKKSDYYGKKRRL